MKFRLSRRGERAGMMAALTALVICLFYLVNTVLLTLADTYSWYFYTDEQYDLSISAASEELLGKISTDKKVKIVFCQPESRVQEDKQLDYVYDTAQALAKRHPDLIQLEFINLWLEPARLEPYRTDEDGNERKITTASVIIDYGGTYLHNTASSFYILDENSYVTAYCGEETFVANILWVTADEHPVAYFTANHGEEVPEGLYRSLTYAGYKVNRLDLSEVSAVPDDAGLVFIFAPVYDFQKAAEGSSYDSELKKLESYLASGGDLFVSLDPSRTAGLPRLLEFLSQYGLGMADGTLSDGENALPGSGGTALFTTVGDGALADRLATAAGARTVFANAGALTLSPVSGAESEILLKTHASAGRYSGGGTLLASGGMPLLTRTVLTGGGQIVTAGSAYFAASDILYSASYGNRALFYLLLSECFDATAPVGVPFVAIDRSAIENLTLGEANFFATLTCAVLPAGILIGGLIYCRRRKNH